jgi:RecA-family ATPase
MFKGKAQKEKPVMGHDSQTSSNNTEELTTAHSQIRLPERTQQFAESGAPQGQRNDELFHAACQCRDARLNIEAAKAQLSGTAKWSGLREGEIDSAIRSAYSRPPRAPIGRGTQYSRPPAQLTPKLRKIETQPEPLPDYIEDGFVKLLEAAFKPDEYVSIGCGYISEPDANGKKYHAIDEGFTLTPKSWIESLKASTEDRDTTLGKILKGSLGYGGLQGLYVRINPMVEDSSDNEHVTAFRRALIEADTGSKEDQLGALRKIGLPITAIIDSGGKSVHAWVRIDAESEKEYAERVALLYQYCEQSLGLDIDGGNKNPSRYSRMPNAVRMRIDKKDNCKPVLGPDGKPIIDRQRLLEVNVRGKSWDEWSAEIVSLDLTAQKSLPAFESWEDLKEADLPELKIIIPGVLNQGAKMTVGGASKAGKTWLLMDLAFAIATGRPWLGLETNEGRVLYVNLEIQRQYFRKRCELILWKRMMSPKVPNFLSWTLRGHFMTAELFKEAILERIGDEKFAVIFVDPLYKLLNGADTNSAGEMQKILAELEQIAEGAGAALIYADHFAKGNMAVRSAIDRISGSGVNARDPDVICTFSELEDPLGAGDGRMAAEFTLRNFKPIESFAVAKIKGAPLFERRGDIDHKRLAGIPGAKSKFSESDLLPFLPDEGGVSSDEWYKAVKLVTGMSERTFNGFRSNLKKAGCVYDSKVDGNILWVKTAKGIEQQRKASGSAPEPQDDDSSLPESDPFE